MTTRVERLRAYIDATEDKAPVLGVDDCGPWVANWIEQETGKKVSFPKYETREQAANLIAVAGDLASFVAPMMAGLELTDEPQAGDVGVFFTGTRQMCAIVVGHDHIVIRGETKAAYFLRARELIKAWRLP